MVDDSVSEPSETVIVTLGAPTNATLGTTTVQTNHDHRQRLAATVSLSAATQSVTESVGSVTVTANLPSASGLAVSVPYTVSGPASNPADHNLANWTINIASRTDFRLGELQRVDDAIDEADETVS